MWCKQTWVAVALALLGGVATVQGQSQTQSVFDMGPGLTSLEFVPVGNAGNTADTTGLGAVATNYQMGKFEVTAAQYTMFLNAVAGVDTYGLYNTAMAGEFGCGISSGGDGTYSVASGWENRPVNFVSWGDAARFVNWLHNGQLAGAQDGSTTEDGAYSLNGAVDLNPLSLVTRNDGAKYFLPTRDEWYKAAYYDPDSESYYDYPTSSDDAPGNNLPDTGNNANYYDGDFALMGPHYTSNVGDFENSASPYGTFDQGGNVWEWNESSDGGVRRGVLGGGWASTDVGDLLAGNTDAIWLNATSEDTVGLTGSYYGFRVATVPEPGSLTLLLLGALMGFFCWRRRK